MRIVVLAVGRLRPPYLDDVEHYLKLVRRQARVEIVELREDEQVERRIPEGAYVSVLAAEGAAMDSVAFSRFLEDRRHGGRDVYFVIGGAKGLTLDRAVDHHLSLGPMTLPHQLARVVLLEQLFRGHKILANEPYHY